MRVNWGELVRISQLQSSSQARSPAGVGGLEPSRAADPVGVFGNEFGQLRQLAQNEPEIRTGLIARVRARLAEGFYMTDEAAEQAAEAMLDRSQL